MILTSVKSSIDEKPNKAKNGIHPITSNGKDELTGLPKNKQDQFLFSVLQYEKSRYEFF